MEVKRKTVGPHRPDRRTVRRNHQSRVITPPSSRVAYRARTRRSIVSRRNRTDPSAARQFTPPECSEVSGTFDPSHFQGWLAEKTPVFAASLYQTFWFGR